MSFDETNYCLNMNANMSISSVCLFLFCWFLCFLPVSFFVCFFGEFDPGSGRTLAACLTHASRTVKGLAFVGSG